MPRQTPDYDPLNDELPPELASQYAVEQRRQRLAEAMLGQAMQPLQVPEVKGRFQGAISPWQGLSQIAQAYMLNKGIGASQGRMADIGKQVEADRSTERKRIADVISGTSERSEQLPEGVYGPPAMLPATQPGNRQQIMQAMLQSRIPEYRKTAEEMMIKEKLAVPESPWAKIDPKDYTPESLAAYAVSKNPADLRSLTKPAGKMGTEDVHIGGGKWQSFKVTPEGQVDLKSPIGEPFDKRPTASSVTASATAALPKGDTKYAETRLGDAAKAMGDLTKSAESAYKSIQALERFEDASKKGTQGGVQPVISGVQNLLSSFGYSAESLKDVRQMEQAVGDILGSKMAELGARGLTDKDMEVLRQALPRINTDRASRDNVVRILKIANNAVIKEWEGQREQESQTYPDLSSRIPEPVWYKNYKSRTPSRRSTDKPGTVLRFDAQGNPLP